MRRLRTWLSESLNMDCLRSLAFMNIHRDIGIDNQEVAEKVLGHSPTKDK